MAIVTIRGHLGSGAPEIGRLIARKIQADYVDREIIAEMAARLERKEQDIVEKETPPGTLLGRIAEALSHSSSAYPPEASIHTAVYLPVWDVPLDDTSYAQALETVIKELAQNQPIVIRGRGSQFILKDYPNTFHVMIVAPLENRVKYVMETMNLGKEAAAKEIERQDKSYREFIRRYFKNELGNPVNYDMVINAGYFTYEDCASIIVNAIPLKQ